MIPILTGVEMDIENSYSWNIAYTSGTYEETNSLKTIEPFIINLDPDDYRDNIIGTAWTILYNTQNGDIITAKKPDDDICDYIDIGGFMLTSGCNIKHIHPESDCIVYKRVFTLEHDSDYYHGVSEIDICNPCAGAFNIDFDSTDIGVYDSTCVS